MENNNSSNKIRVLLIEDDFYVRQLYSDAFDLEPGYELFIVSELKSPEQALEKIREVSPDVILLDLILPLRSDDDIYVLDKELGFEILENLKKDNELSKIPVIVVSNLSGFLEKEKAKALGAEVYLVKSEIFPQQLISTIDKVLSLK